MIETNNVDVILRSNEKLCLINEIRFYIWHMMPQSKFSDIKSKHTI